MAGVLGRLSRLSGRTRSQWIADADLKQEPEKKGLLPLISLSFAALGVIYGDIGTSPLYVISTIFKDKEPSPEDVLCSASLIFWSITLVVLVNYVLIILRADDHGEGGTLALYALITRSCGIPAINSGSMPADQALFAASRNVDRRSVDRQGHQPTLATVPQEHTMEPTKEATISRTGAALKHLLGGNTAVKRLLLLVAVIMTGMVLGDGVLTPSISVLSAVQGLQNQAGISQDAVIGITCAILAVLFGFQSFGTQRVGIAFAPTVLLWFTGNVLIASYNIAKFEGGAIFRALSPHYIGIWFQNHGTAGWAKLAGVFLCLTGCEAMFADLGHFTRRSVWVSFTLVAYPSLIITYFGQASWLMHNLDGYSAVFYNSIPSHVFWPMFVVSVATAVVASQALITGSFSIVNQSMALSILPRFKVKHTSKAIGGQVYIPAVNWVLLVLCIAVVAGFRDGAAIGNAYGIAVNMVMLGSVFLVTIVILVVWGKSPLLAAAYCVPYAVIVGTFLSANLLNVPNGGWFSIAVATVLAAISVLYIYGTSEKVKALRRDEFSLSDVMTYKRVDNYPNVSASEAGPSLAAPSWTLYRVSTMTPLPRNPGMALVYAESPFHVPAMYRRIVESWGVHNMVVFITVRQVPVPFVSEADRLLLAPLEYRGFYRCVARYGYLDRVDQGPAFAQSVLDKIAVVTPNAAVMDGVTVSATNRALSNTEANTKEPIEVAAISDGATTCTTVIPSSPEGAEHPRSFHIPTSPQVAWHGGAVVVVQAADDTHVSGVASRAVYVLQRTSIRCVGGQKGFGGRVMGVARKVVLEDAYQLMWQLCTRFWQGMEIPVSRVFEVGMLLEV